MFCGVSLSGIGISVVHVGHEELLYISGQQLTADYVLSQRTATLELMLHALQVDNQQVTATLPAIISLAGMQVSVFNTGSDINSVIAAIGFDIRTG